MGLCTCSESKFGLVWISLVWRVWSFTKVSVTVLVVVMVVWRDEWLTCLEIPPTATHCRPVVGKPDKQGDQHHSTGCTWLANLKTIKCVTFLNSF